MSAGAAVKPILGMENNSIKNVCKKGPSKYFIYVEVIEYNKDIVLNISLTDEISNFFSSVLRSTLGSTSCKVIFCGFSDYL